jgi:transcriptional regulator with XRE-family HTH domain
MGPEFLAARLAEVTRLHRNEIGNIERGIVEPRLTTIVILADGLNVTMAELVAELAVPPTRSSTPSRD